MKLNKKSVNTKSIIAATIAATLLFGAVTAYAIHYRTQLTEKTPTASTTSPSESTKSEISYSAPSKTDIEESQDAKKALSEQKGRPTTTEAQVGIANYFVSNESVEIRAFTPSVVEGDGTCTAILAQSDNEVTASSKAFIDATTSQCKPITIPLSEFPTKGTWKLKVTYESAEYKGTSPVMEVKL